VRAIAQDADGVMWFGTDAGLARYDGRRVQTVTDEGLSGPRVHALSVDALGTLWVGADGGAYVRAAGAQTFHHIAETKGKSVLAVFAPAPRRALLATADGLVFECRQEADGALAVRQLGERLTVGTGKAQAVELSSLALMGETVVVGTRGRGLVTVEPTGEAREISGRPRAFYVESLAQTSGGALLFGAQTSGGDSGLFRVDEGRLTRPVKISGATGTVNALASAHDGDIYAATAERGVFRYRADGQLLEHFTFAGTAGGLRSDKVNAVFVDREGVAWFGTPRGVCRYDPKGVRVEQLSADTESNFVRSLYRTSRGRLLVGTSAGLFARDESAGAWREVEEVAGKTVYALAEDSRGLLLVGTGAGLFVGLQAEGHAPRQTVKLAPETKAAEGEAEGKRQKAEVKSQKSKVKSGGTVEGTGASLTGDEGKVEGAQSGANEDEKVAVGNPSEQGAAESSASELKPSESDESESVKKTAEPALSGSVRAIARFGESVYVATFGRGLERFDGPGRRTLVWPRAGENVRGREVVSLFADDARGRLWIGTANAGVFYFDGASVKTEPALEFLRDSTVWGASGADGWLWLATGRGLYAFREGRAPVEVASGVDARAVVAVGSNGASAQAMPQAWCATAGAGVLKAALDEQFGALASRLDTEQGLPTENAFAVLAINSEDRENASHTGDGGVSLVVGTTRGLARYEPSTLAPVLRLVRVTASRTYQPEEIRGTLRLSYPQNGLVLDVAAGAGRTFPEQFQYAFTLRDQQGRAIKQKLSRDSQFQIEGLPAGLYTLTARAFTLDLTPSETLRFDFEVARAPFPRTTVALSVLLALALVALVVAYFQRRRIVRSREELRDANHQLAAARLQLASEAEAERRRIARDLHDQTLADLRRLLLLTDEMQPGNLTSGTTAGLTTTATATSVVDPSQLRAEIEAISQEVRRICEDLSPSVLENVGFAAALEFALAATLAHMPAERKFTYDFSCDENLEERLHLAPGVQMQVYRIVQEAVSNVCRHAHAAHVRLRIHVDDAGNFVLTLEDDGCGFDPNTKKGLATGRGISGIRARASLIEADVEWRKRDEGGTIFVLRKKTEGTK
jgi:signal transduction histidine kinase/ligand-binding sensor domain-containing protein